MEFETFIVLLPTGFFSKEAAIAIENKTIVNIYDTDFAEAGAEVYRLTEFADACNHREIDFSKYYVSFVNATI